MLYLCYTVTSWIWTRFFNVDVLQLDCKAETNWICVPPPVWHWPGCWAWWIWSILSKCNVDDDDDGMMTSAFGLLDVRIGGCGGIFPCDFDVFFLYWFGQIEMVWWPLPVAWFRGSVDWFWSKSKSKKKNQIYVECLHYFASLFKWTKYRLTHLLFIAFARTLVHCSLAFVCARAALQCCVAGRWFWLGMAFLSAWWCDRTWCQGNIYILPEK